jgi:hypothetical protein
MSKFVFGVAYEISLIMVIFSIAVLQTTRTIVLWNRSPIPLGSISVNSWAVGTILGFGRTSTEGSLSTNLQFIQKLVITNGECSRHWPGRINAGRICTLARIGQGLCVGDQGG